MKCKICSTNTHVHDNAKILNKYMITYYLCPACRFIQTEEPYWIDESYSKAIAKSDTGIMMRNMANAINLLFYLKKSPQSQCLDFGGGHGLLTRIMRDYGFDFYHYDKYAENLFATGFEGDVSGRKTYKLVIAFENFEHFSNPLEEIERLLSISETLYFSTLLLPDCSPPSVKEWWHYAPQTGQHISFYSENTLKYIAQKYNLYFVSNTMDTHILSRNRINKHYFKFLRCYNKVINTNIVRFFKQKSKTIDDMNAILYGFQKG